MQIIDDDLLLAFRLRLRCELCGRAGPVDPDHYWFRRGMGGGSRIDHPFNLIAACRPCHDRRHQTGRPTKQKLLEMVARREGRSPTAILAELQRLYDLPKTPTILRRPRKKDR